MMEHTAVFAGLVQRMLDAYTEGDREALRLAEQKALDLGYVEKRPDGQLTYIEWETLAQVYAILLADIARMEGSNGK